MNCTNPNFMVYNGLDKKGKLKMDFYNNLEFTKLVHDFVELDKLGVSVPPFVQIPCGKCLSCKISYSRAWADRITLESSKYTNNFFITLTYDDHHLLEPLDDDYGKDYSPASLSKRHAQLFMKSIRKLYGKGIKYFLCGEYGDSSLRKHLHVILLNCPINDLSKNFKQIEYGDDGSKKVVTYNRSGYDKLFFSEDIWNCWHRRGEISVGEFSYDTASYVAQYCQKKYDPRNAEARELMHLYPEFVLMSKGMAKDFVDLSLYELDNIVVDGHVSAVPRYFDKKIKELIGEKEFYHLVGYNRINRKLITLDDYLNGQQKRESDLKAQNDCLIKKNKMRVAI